MNRSVVEWPKRTMSRPAPATPVPVLVRNWRSRLAAVRWPWTRRTVIGYTSERGSAVRVSPPTQADNVIGKSIRWSLRAGLLFDPMDGFLLSPHVRVPHRGDIVVKRLAEICWVPRIDYRSGRRGPGCRMPRIDSKIRRMAQAFSD